jgi:hypothetical protein
MPRSCCRRGPASRREAGADEAFGAPGFGKKRPAPEGAGLIELDLENPALETYQVLGVLGI